MHARSPRHAAMALTVLMAFSACGDDDRGDGNGGAGLDAAGADLSVVAHDPVDFDRDAYTAPAGEIAVAYRNEGGSRHTLAIDDVDGFKLEVRSRGDVDTGSVELEAGDYVLYCDVAGHRSAGMEATLTVE